MTYLGLKDVLRQGWVNAGVESPESVAAHSWGMAILALKLCPADLNLEHVLKLCLVHDLPEVIVGDLTPQDDVSTKSEDERAAMEHLAPEWVSLFDEYENQTTPEAVFVKSLDKLDMALQAKVYMNRSELDLEQFIESAKKTLGDHELLRYLHLCFTKIKLRKRSTKPTETKSGTAEVQANQSAPKVLEVGLGLDVSSSEWYTTAGFQDA